MSKRIALVIGHGPSRDKGAYSQDGNTNELTWNRDLAVRIVRHIAGRVPVVVVHRVIEKVQPVKEINATGASIAVELHLNSFNNKASGTEMFYYPTSKKGKLLAEKLQYAAVSALGLANRGAKGRSAGRGAPFLKNTAVLVESFFIDNDNDLVFGNQKKDLLAKTYADVLVAMA